MKFSIQARVSNLDTACAYFDTLKFTRQERRGDQWITYADTGVIVEVTTDAKSRTGLKCYRDSDAADEPQMVQDPDGNKIFFSHEPEPNFAVEQSILGSCMGIGLECMDLGKSMAFYLSHGLQTINGSVDQGWLELGQNGRGLLSLMKWGSCPHLFINPSIMYFNGSRNLSVIDHLRKIGIPLTEELTIFNEEGLVDNVVLEAPGRIGIFAFSD